MYNAITVPLFKEMSFGNEQPTQTPDFNLDLTPKEVTQFRVCLAFSLNIHQGFFFYNYMLFALAPTSTPFSSLLTQGSTLFEG